MKPYLALASVTATLTLFSFGLSAAPIDWSQPPMIACVEEAVPHPPDRPCLDLSGVAKPGLDWPADLPGDELAYWKSDRRATQVCRGREVLRREAASPGSFSAGAIEVAWMQVAGASDTAAKADSVYEASRRNKMPAHVLAGALYQESMFVALGITADGGNYSCGVGQSNITEWCRWANQQSAAKKKELGWPGVVECGSLPSTLLKPFHDIALTKLNGLPDYRMTKAQFAGIKYDQVVGGFPAGDAVLQKLRYQAATSFINTCENVGDAIAAKANELANLYRQYVPQGMKEREQYPAGQAFQRRCRQRGYDGYYPLHGGWLMAVGAYNAGPRAIDTLAHYNGWSADDVAKPATFAGVTPVEMVRALYWAGKYSAVDDRIHYQTLGGADASWNWFKVCVLQRHIARVVQHVTLTGFPAPVDSLEGANVCARSVFDADGKLVTSGVPEARQKSTGVKPPAFAR